MGWFVIAFIVGFLMFWGWRWLLSLWPGGPQTKALGVILLVVLGGIAIDWAWETARHDYSAKFILDWIGQGYAVRIALGLVLGIATGYVVEQRAKESAQLRFDRMGRPRPRPLPDAADPGAPGLLQSIAGASATTLLWVALAAACFAIAAPHLDNWLRHVTSVKLPFGELQVASIGFHQVIKADHIDWFSDESSLDLLRGYNRRIRQDVDYIIAIEIPALEEEIPKDAAAIARKQKIAKTATELLTVFDGLISPIAGCVRDAISNGMGIDSVRMKARTTADLLEHVISIEDTPGINDEYTADHMQFWEELMALPSGIEPFLGKRREACLNIAENYDRTAKFAFPKIRDYKTIPYLYVAALCFASFMKDDQIYIKIIQDKLKQDKKDRLEFIDYGFEWFTASLSYGQGQPMDVGLSMLEDLRRTAREHQKKIAAKKQKCEKEKCDKAALIADLDARERDAYAQATNSLANYVAGELAEGSRIGQSYAARAEDLAREMWRISRVKEEDKTSYLDTYAYLTIVLEARKKEPNLEKIKEMVGILEKVVEDLETPKQDSFTDRFAIINLRLIRSHLAAARELAAQ